MPKLRTRQSNRKGKWEWTSISHYKTKAKAKKAAKRLRKELQKDKASNKRRGKKFYYRVEVLS